MEFMPWETHNGCLPVAIDVSGPPCLECKHWNPVAVSDRNGQFDGVRLCHSKDQCHDFSCYRARSEERPPSHATSFGDEVPDMSRMRWTREEVEAYVSGWRHPTTRIYVADFSTFGPVACKVLSNGEPADLERLPPGATITIDTHPRVSAPIGQTARIDSRRVVAIFAASEGFGGVQTLLAHAL